MRLRTTVFFAACLTLCACGGIGSDTTSSQIADESFGLENITIDNFAEVEPGIYRSGRPDGTQVGELARLDIHTILSLETFQYEVEAGREIAEAAKQHGIKLIKMPMSPFFTTVPSVDELKERVEVLNKRDLQPILVHCRKGSDRTGIVVASFRILTLGWTIEDAITEMENMGQNRLYSKWHQQLYRLK